MNRAVTTDFTITKNTDFRAVYSVSSYTITPSVDGVGGSIIPSTEQVVEYNGNKVFTFTPDNGYEVAEILVNGVAATISGNTFTLSNIKADTTLVVKFKKRVYNVTPSVIGGNGTITPSTVQSVEYGSSVTFTFSPNVGYVVNQVLVNGSAVTITGNTYTIENITRNTTISVRFVLNSYTVRFLDDNGGVLKTESVTHGGTATPPNDPVKPGYIFTGWEKQ